jgi:predicted transcriptional regulator of viral defense system
MPSSAENQILALLDEQRLVTTEEVKERGIPSIYLTRMVRKGTLERVARGLYERTGASRSEHVTLAEAAKLVPAGVLCLFSALELHELTVQQPRAVWIALPAHARTPIAGNIQLEVVRMSEAALRSGVETREIDGVRIRVFDVSKTIADLFKFRSRVGLDVALEALKAYWRSEHRNLEALHRYARIDRVQRLMRPYIETLAA